MGYATFSLINKHVSAIAGIWQGNAGPTHARACSDNTLSAAGMQQVMAGGAGEASGWRRELSGEPAAHRDRNFTVSASYCHRMLQRLRSCAAGSGG